MRHPMCIIRSSTQIGIRPSAACSRVQENKQEIKRGKNNADKKKPRLWHDLKRNHSLSSDGKRGERRGR